MAGYSFPSKHQKKLVIGIFYTIQKIILQNMPCSKNFSSWPASVKAKEEWLRPMMETRWFIKNKGNITTPIPQVSVFLPPP
ncbi:hypothetical protein D1164_22520 [Mariniphaga sediminis]|jgi:hypothetical protein|uniref:Uncharacterized protein n=1 Tax=Mariniphaga sediminis TaxID=1628158 RepID=A0A399CWP1_9BACT|nr:hypothetical protein D1164_22520 [Mariniphaga sediminis]